MPAIHKGRHTAAAAAPLVVFVIGLRVNRALAVHKWLPVARAMGPMLAELAADGDSGFMGAETLWQPWRTVLLLQYWRDFDALERYARADDRQHLPAWAAFNRAIGSDGSVGIFHETYCVPAGGSETIYANMPAFGLGAVAGLVPAEGSRRSARMRLGASPTTGG